MSENDEPQKSSLAPGWSLSLQFLLVFAIAALILFAGNRWGVANDCAALGVTHDGQCGLATFIGDLMGFCASCISLFFGCIVVVVRWKKRHKSTVGRAEN